MNIAFIIQDYNYHGGGQVTANLAEHLQSLGHSVKIIAIQCNEGDVESRPKVFSNILDLNATGLFSSIFKLTKVFRDSRYDVIICIGGYSNLSVSLAKFLSRSSTPVIGSEHFATSVLIGDYPKVFLRLSLPLFKFAYAKLNGLVFVSDKLRLEFLKKNSWHPSRCITIDNPIRSPKKKLKENVKSKVSGVTFLGVGVLEPRKRFDLLLKSFSMIASPNDKLLIAGTGSLQYELESLSKELGIESQVNFLGFVDDIDSLMRNSDIKHKVSGVTFLGVGVLEPRKRFDLLLKSFSMIASPNDKLLIAGTGSLQHELESLSKDLGIESQVNFLGFVDDIDSLMRNSDIFVLTSNSEAFGLVLVEGLAAGLQVVSTDSFSGPSEVLGNGRYGFLAEVNDVNSIASSMKAAIDSPISQEIIHEGASRFSIDSIVKKYLEFITIVIASDGNLDDPI